MAKKFLTPINLPHGAAPTAPGDGDIWTSTDGLYSRIDGVTVGPYGIGTAKTFYQNSIPASATAGDIWVDSDGKSDMINADDFVLKTGGAFTGLVSNTPAPVESGFNPFFLGGM